MDPTNGNIADRLDRVEIVMEKLAASQRQLLTAQVVLTDTVGHMAGIMTEIAEAQKHTDENMAELAEAQKHTDERINALIDVGDGLVRRPPDQQ